MIRKVLAGFVLSCALAFGLVVAPSPLQPAAQAWTFDNYVSMHGGRVTGYNTNGKAVTLSSGTYTNIVSFKAPGSGRTYYRLMGTNTWKFVSRGSIKSVNGWYQVKVT